MTKPSIVARLDLAQNRTEALADILQDTLDLAQTAHLPTRNLCGLKRAVEGTETIFYTLAAIRTRLKRTHPHLPL